LSSPQSFTPASTVPLPVLLPADLAGRGEAAPRELLLAAPLTAVFASAAAAAAQLTFCDAQRFASACESCAGAPATAPDFSVFQLRVSERSPSPPVGRCICCAITSSERWRLGFDVWLALGCREHRRRSTVVAPSAAYYSDGAEGQRWRLCGDISFEFAAAAALIAL
jgi:hypothetical protein